MRRSLPDWVPHDKRRAILELDARREVMPPGVWALWLRFVSYAAIADMEAARQKIAPRGGCVPLQVAATLATPEQLDAMLRGGLIGRPIRSGYPIVDWDSAGDERAMAK